MSRPDVLIVGQGLAGTMLAWELERAGIAFAIAESDRAPSASRVAAGIMNPVTGRRLVKTWRAEALVPVAREAYTALAEACGVALWRDLRVRRWFASPAERAAHRAKAASGELAPFLGDGDAEGCWIERAGRVDLPALLAAGRARWEAQGRLRRAEADPVSSLSHHDAVIDCRGLAGTRAGFDFVPWEYSRGEVLEIDASGLAPDVVLNRGHWVLPLDAARACVGATHEPGVSDPTPTPTGRRTLEQAAAQLLQRAVVVRAHRAGVRVNLPDKRPVAGRHPQTPRLGVLNGLGAKGVLLAPWLARSWARHLDRGEAFDPAVEVARFAR